jgi:hypothetical protein
MDDTIRVFSGRTFSPEDIELIKWARKTYHKLPRHEFASTVCELLGWTTPAGRAKWHPCLAFLEQLEAEGIIRLPEVKNIKKTAGKVKIIPIEFDTSEITGEVKDFEPVKLAIAQPGEELQRWRAYVEQYHMLGFKTVFGSRLQYFIKSGNLELGCIQFSASAWALDSRDEWIGWTVDNRKVRLNLILNNSRFLIFPWVKVKNLASKALSLAVKQIQQDWLREYCYAPVLLETFVDLEHFKGTGYKAANWIYLGKTKGRGRMDRQKQKSLSEKAIFVYPLQHDFKECLRGEKPFKEADPNER